MLIIWLFEEANDVYTDTGTTCWGTDMKGGIWYG